MSSKTIGNSAVELIPRNTSRKSISFQNEDNTDTVYLKVERSENTTVSSTDHDWKMGPGASLFLTLLQDGFDKVQGRWTAISSANTPRVSVFETEDISR